MNFFYPPIVSSGGSGSGADVNAFYALTQSDSQLPNSKVLAPGSGISITVVGSQCFISATGSGGGGGGVVSVGLAAPAEFTVSGSPITSSGTLTFTKASQSANLAYLSPDGSSGVPTFRAINANDFFASLTAGTNIQFSRVGGVLTLAASAIAMSSLIGTLAASAGGTGTSTTPTAGQVPIGTNSSTYIPTTVAAGPGVQVNTGNGFFNIGASGALGGTVTSVGLSLPLYSIANSPVTTAGTLTGSLTAQAASTFLAGPLSGPNATPFFRALASSDISQALSGNLAPGSNVTITQVGNVFTIASTASGSGSVSSVGLALPTSVFTVSGTPVTTTGTLTGTLANQASGQFWAAAPTGTAGAPYFRNIIGSDLSLALQAGLNVTITPSASALVIAASSGSGTVSSVGLSLPSIITVSGSPVTSSGTLTGTLATQASGTAWMGPTSGAAAQPTFRALVGSDLSSVIVAGSNVTITPIGNTLVISAAATGGGGGSVTSVSSGNLTNFATVNVAAPTSTPAFTFTLTTAASGQFFGGPISGSAAAPAYRSLVLSDLPAGTYTSNYSTTLNNFASGSGTGILVQNGSSFLFRTLTGTGNRITVSNGTGVSGNPTIDVGTDVYTISYSNVLNLLASAVPTAGQVLIGNSSGTYTLATIAAGPGIQVNTGSGFTNISASGALGGTVTNFSAGDLSPLFTTTEATTTTTPALTFVQSNAASGAALLGPQFGAAGPYTFRQLASSDIYAADKDVLVAGSNITITPNPGTYQLTISALGSSNTNGTVTSVALALPSIFNTSGSPVTTSGTLTGTLASQASAFAFLGPVSGAAAVPTFRPIQGTDLYAIQAGSNITISQVGSALVLSSTASGGGGGGSVTQVTSGNLTNFATVNVATNTTTPDFTFTLTTAASSQFWGGPISGSAAAPAYRSLVLSDLPVGTYTVNYSNVLNNLASGSGTGIIAQNGSSIAYRTITGTADRVTVTNGDGSAGNPTIDVGANVYTTSTSGLLNKFASATPSNGQLPIGNGTDFTIATLTPGPGIQITNGSGSVTIGNFASGALLTAGDLSPLFTTTESAQNITFNISNAASGTALMGPLSGAAAAYTFRALASSDTYTAVSGNLVAGSNITLTKNSANNTITIASTASGGGSGTALNNANDFRLTLTSGVPITSSDVIAAGTVYWTSKGGGNNIALFDGSSTWTNYTSNELSISTPASLHRIYDVFVYNNSGTPALELNAWDSGGQTTGSITGATAANPCVLTASNSLSVGDYIYVDGITGSMGTNSVQGLNGICCRISARSSTTITLEGMDTSGLTYTSGGTWYFVPQSRTNALVAQDGVLVKTGATTRRYVGSFMTVASAQTEDSNARRFLYNHLSNLARPFWATDPTASWTYVGNGNRRPANACCVAGYERVEVLVGITGSELSTHGCCFQATPGGVNNYVSFGVDTAVTEYANQMIGGFGSTASTSPYFAGSTILGAGYHFIQKIERAQGTCTFFGTNAGYDTPGLTGSVHQ